MYTIFYSFVCGVLPLNWIYKGPIRILFIIIISRAQHSAHTHFFLSPFFSYGISNHLSYFILNVQLCLVASSSAWAKHTHRSSAECVCLRVPVELCEKWMHQRPLTTNGDHGAAVKWLQGKIAVGTGNRMYDPFRDLDPTAWMKQKKNGNIAGKGTRGWQGGLQYNKTITLAAFLPDSLYGSGYEVL